MFKRALAILTAALLFVSICTVSAEENDSSASVKSPMVVQKTKNSYAKYLADNEVAYAKSDIVVSADMLCAGDNTSYLQKDGEKKCLKWDSKLKELNFEFDVKTTAAYEIVFNYKPLEGKGNAIELQLQLDGKSPYSEADKLLLPRLWKDSGDKRIDSIGNETPATQVEAFVWSDYKAQDAVGINVEPLLLVLTAGKHKITIKNKNAEPFLLGSVTFSAVETVPTYSEYVKPYKKSETEKIVLEAENAALKTENSFVGKAERSSAAVSPSSYHLDKINYIGAANWSHTGEKIIWNLDVKKTGWYKLAFKYKQNYVLNGNSYRKLTIDGATPFSEASEIAFPYITDWKMLEYSNKSGEPYLVYLEEGKHELTLEVTLGPMSDIYSMLSEQVEVLGSVYRKMVMIMGTNPDANRDYDLFEQIADLEETFEESYKVLGEIVDNLCALTGNKSDSNTVIIDGMRDSIDKFLKNPYRTQKYKDDYYNNYCSLGAILSEMVTMPLDLDIITFLPEDETTEQFNVSFMDNLKFSVKRFISTFTQDYSSVSDISEDVKEKISIWLYWGKDQVSVLNTLIKEDFTPNHGIQVDIKITNSSLIQALLCDDTPDVYLRHNGLGTINMSMRGALYDLKNFDDFEDFTDSFMPYSFIPYEYQGGCYALPDTETYNMLFYRTDIFEEYGIKVPNTWDEFLDISTFFFHNNLQVGMPNTFNTFATFLYQKGGAVYNNDLSEVMFTDNTFVDAFTYYTDFFKEYGFELAFDFYNRFRTGEMPMGVADYAQYNVLKVSAPEIDGKWAMAILPGTKTEDGLVRTGVATGMGSSIINKSENKQAAWEFLKWWTGADAQERFSNECESILGPSARQQTANVEALSRLSWSDGDLSALLKQWHDTKTIPETPGSYYTERMYTQAFWSVVNNSTNQRNTLVKWGEMANQEIARKRAEYNLD